MTDVGYALVEFDIVCVARTPFYFELTVDLFYSPMAYLGGGHRPPLEMLQVYLTYPRFIEKTYILFTLPILNIIIDNSYY